jgi:hypothetical protein
MRKFVGRNLVDKGLWILDQEHRIETQFAICWIGSARRGA